MSNFILSLSIHKDVNDTYFITTRLTIFIEQALFTIKKAVLQTFHLILTTPPK